MRSHSAIAASFKRLSNLEFGAPSRKRSRSNLTRDRSDSDEADPDMDTELPAQVPAF